MSDINTIANNSDLAEYNLAQIIFTDLLNNNTIENRQRVITLIDEKITTGTEAVKRVWENVKKIFYDSS